MRVEFSHVPFQDERKAEGNLARVAERLPPQLLMPLASLLAHSPDPDGALHVDGVDSHAVGELAAANGFVLHELVEHRPSLEEAFIELTDGSVEFAGSTTAGDRA